MKTFACAPAAVLGALASLVLLAPVASAQSTVSGDLTSGPANQGTCTLSGAEAYLCDNGAFCEWQSASSSFSCVGGTGTVDAIEAAGPPGRTCTAHEDHWDCDDGSFCEYTENAWVCEGGSSSAHGESSGGSTSDSCNGVDLGEYDMDLHIVALFILLISSAIGVFLPVVCSNLLRHGLFGKAFFAAKHFGTGIIISTAFVHLLYHSFIMFGNACLGELHFEPAAAAIAMAGTYVVFTVDYCVMRWLKSRGDHRAAANANACADGIHPDEIDSPAPSTAAEKGPVDLGHSHGPAPNQHTDFSSAQAHFDVMILEAGIIFHSIMIGVSLGASGGSQWVPLFCAIIFHQLFEGLALGSRIGQLVWPASAWWKKWVMATVFTLITPVGIAIGIGVHQSYNPNSGAALLSIGVLDSISAGILIYGGLVEMLYHDFMHGELAHARWPKVALAAGFLLLGSLLMLND
ncbi:hypothetical protein Rhopal_006548-T1 [Rhodotorula paludigena]|uniref:Uncharacterized protein n=1 Tax=Rhodotorula paludigena TaxID=86838 RepID=A0AAV5GVH5_9BASI|nr:hypothetical protein Rhopal_006548-T1 [Rhodotorula paludigena]